MEGFVTINLQTIDADMARHLGEYKRLRRFRQQLIRYADPGVPESSEGLKSALELRQRFARASALKNPAVSLLREFVLHQSGTFDHPALKSVLPESVHKKAIREAIRLLEVEGVLMVIKPPNGRFRGEYRRRETMNGKAAESLNGHPPLDLDSHPTVGDSSE